MGFGAKACTTRRLPNTLTGKSCLLLDLASYNKVRDKMRLPVSSSAPVNYDDFVEI